MKKCFFLLALCFMPALWAADLSESLVASLRGMKQKITHPNIGFKLWERNRDGQNDVVLMLALPKEASTNVIKQIKEMLTDNFLTKNDSTAEWTLAKQTGALDQHLEFIFKDLPSITCAEIKTTPADWGAQLIVLTSSIMSVTQIICAGVLANTYFDAQQKPSIENDLQLFGDKYSGCIDSAQTNYRACEKNCITNLARAQSAGMKIATTAHEFSQLYDTSIVATGVLLSAELIEKGLKFCHPQAFVDDNGWKSDLKNNFNLEQDNYVIAIVHNEDTVNFEVELDGLDFFNVALRDE